MEPEAETHVLCSFCATRTIIMSGETFVKIRQLDTKDPVTCDQCADDAVFETRR